MAEPKTADGGDCRRIVSILSAEGRDFVVKNNGDQVPVTELVGKHILLYFSAQWCGPCRAFLPKLIEHYREIKSKEPAVEVIFVSFDRAQATFDDFFSSMPWLAVPFGDERQASLKGSFEIRSIPSIVVIAPGGETVTRNAKDLMLAYGAEAYPFTEERVRELEAGTAGSKTTTTP